MKLGIYVIRGDQQLAAKHLHISDPNQVITLTAERSVEPRRGGRECDI